MSDARDAKRLWESFEPIQTVEEARKLSRAGTYACLTLVGCNVYATLVGVTGWDTTFLGSVLPLVFLYLNEKRKHLWPAYCIIVWSAFEVLDALAFLVKRVDLSFVYCLAAGAAMLLAIQNLRALKALRRFDPSRAEEPTGSPLSDVDPIP